MTTSREPMDRFQKARSEGYIDAISRKPNRYLNYADDDECRAYELGYMDGKYLIRTIIDA